MDKTGREYIKRTQKDYSMSFKLAVVQEYENTGISQMALQRKYGIQGNNTLKRWIENTVTLTSRTNPASQWKRVRTRSF